MPDFIGFTEHTLPVSETVSIYTLKAGNGPPILLLHGHPQTHLIWADVAPGLIKDYTVIVPDLRGSGKSSKPGGGIHANDPEHKVYSKRAMAGDLVAVMKHFGFDRFKILAHDRGARVAHRLALDYPQCVERMMLIDIVPTLKQYACPDGFAFAKSYYHWYFLIQAEPLPETFINKAPANYLASSLPIAHDQVPGQPMKISHPLYKTEHLSAYLDMYTDPAAVHAACEDYRAAATIDLQYDRESIAASHHIQCPLHVVWGSKGIVGKLFDPVAEWQEVAGGTVTGEVIPDCGHFVPDERPEQVLAHARTFFVSNK